MLCLEKYPLLDAVPRSNDGLLADNVRANRVAVAILHQLLQLDISFHVKFVAEIDHCGHEDSRIIDLRKVILELNERDIWPEWETFVPDP